MTLNVLLYTTVAPSKLTKDLAFVRARLMRTPGRTDVTFTVKRIKPFSIIQTEKDAGGVVRPKWSWFDEMFVKSLDLTKYNAVCFHFAPSERRKWKFSTSLNGSYHLDTDGVLDFWACADPGVKAKNYPFSDFARIMIHEIGHGDIHLLNRDQALVHTADYINKAIDTFPETYFFPLEPRKPRLVLPIPRRHFERVTQAFLTPSEHYKSGVHNGTDFGCPVGTPLVAPCDGEVYYRAIEHPSLGNAAYFRFVLDGKTYHARFLHLSTAVPLGKYKQGDVMGATGNTGDSTGPHLHIDIWNTAIDTGLIRTRKGVEAYMLDPIAFFKEAKG